MLERMGHVIFSPAFIDLEHPAILRALFRHILDHADVAGVDVRGRPVLRFEVVCEPWLLDKLAAFGAAEEDLEDDDPAESSG